jgi:hypothetical protein
MEISPMLMDQQNWYRKMAILPKAIYMCSAILMKIPSDIIIPFVAHNQRYIGQDITKTVAHPCLMQHYS